MSSTPTRPRIAWLVVAFAFGAASSWLAWYSAMGQPRSVRHFLGPLLAVLLPVLAVNVPVRPSFRKPLAIAAVAGLLVGAAVIAPHEFPILLIGMAGFGALVSAIWWLVFGIPRLVRKRHDRQAHPHPPR